MDAISTVESAAATALFAKENHFKASQNTLVRNLVKSKGITSLSLSDIENIEFFVREEDKADLQSVYVTGLTDKTTLLHLVFNDEFFPIKKIDEKYRELRMEAFGRTIDVESMSILRDRLTFFWTFSGPQPFWSNFHLFWVVSRVRDKKIYVTTWNHLMNFRPGLIGHQRFKQVFPEIRAGTRQDAIDEN